MAAPRLTFLWPMLWKDIENTAPLARRVTRSRALHATHRRQRPETIAQRYGSANEPPPHLPGGKEPAVQANAAADEQMKLPKIGEKLQTAGEKEAKADTTDTPASTVETLRIGPELPTAAAKTTQSPTSDPMLDAAEAQPPAQPPEALGQLASKPLETVLDSVPKPQVHHEEIKAGSTPTSAEGQISPFDLAIDEHSPPISKSPHLDAPPFVHHFDTYGLVKTLTAASWSNERAITSMKAVRLMLADNMDLARSALVSKSMVENETYLFRAACAELRTEIVARRKAEQEKMRTERTQLQHEVDILGQRMSQESATLKDELKGMFDDRKMSVRNEQRGMESKVQQLNYKITVNLQADARSDVEGLRWVLTRRVIIALASVVVMVLGTLKMAANAAHEAEAEAKRRKDTRSGGTQTDEGSGGGMIDRIEGRAEERLEGRADLIVKEMENPGYVSLG